MTIIISPEVLWFVYGFAASTILWIGLVVIANRAAKRKGGK